MTVSRACYGHVNHLRKRAFSGDSEAQFELGWHCYSGRGVRVDYAGAAAWWSRAAEQGHRQAHFDLHVMFRQTEDGAYAPVMPI